MGKPSLKVDMGLVRKLSTYFIRRPANMFARVYRGATQSIADSTWTAISFTAERWDTGTNSTYPNGFWVNTAATRLTATVSGNYIFTGHISFAADATGIRAVAIRLNGATYIVVDQRPSAGAAANTAISIATSYYLAAGDYAELMVYQNSGGALNVATAANYSPEFTITRVP
jgi:hypothetical protein